MKILHVTSDWAWTGPAEPMLLLVQALRARGHEVELACPGPRVVHETSIADEARARGIEPVLELSYARGIRAWRDRDDARSLSSVVAERAVDVVHAWHSRAHGLALRACSGRRSASAIVRSHASADAIPRTPWNRALFGPGCDGLLCVSPASASRNTRLRGGRALVGCLPPIDLRRFDVDPVAGERAADLLRKELGLDTGAPVIGVVARVQASRRFDLLWQALALAVQARPETRLLLLGRGTRFEELARLPVERLGLQEHVVFAGQRRDDYVAALHCMDLLTFLVPGSDGGCRAVAEAAACGVPSVTTRRGALPERIQDGKTGLLIDEAPEALAAAWDRLLSDEALRTTLGRAAREHAHEHFAPDDYAKAVEKLYLQSQDR